MTFTEIEVGSLVKQEGSNKIYQILDIYYNVVENSKRFQYTVKFRNINEQTEVINMEKKEFLKAFSIIGFCSTMII